MDPTDVRERVSELYRIMRETGTPDDLDRIARELIQPMIDYWDVHPHSAMEMLEVTCTRMPLATAYPFVRMVVLGWRGKLNYDPSAGGGADHCYLSALILSENLDLIEFPWASNILPSCVEKFRSPWRNESLPDIDKRTEIVESLALSLRM